MNKQVEMKAEQKRLKKLREEELRRFELEQKQRKKKFWIASSIFIGVVAIALAIFISYMNEELPGVTDLYKTKATICADVANSVQEYLTDEKAAVVTVYYNSQKANDGSTYRVKVIYNDKTIKFFSNPSETFDSKAAGKIENMFKSRLNDISGVLSNNVYSCTFSEQSYDYYGSVNKLIYTTDSKALEASVAELGNYKKNQAYNDNWFYYTAY